MKKKISQENQGLIMKRLMQGSFYIVTCQSNSPNGSDTQKLYCEQHLAISEEDAIDMGKENSGDNSKNYEIPKSDEAGSMEFQWSAEKIT